MIAGTAARARPWLIALALVALIALLLLPGCTQSQSQVRSTGSTSDLSESREHVLSVPAEAEHVELHVDLDASTGTVTWQFFDPHGEQRTTSDAGEGEHSTDETFAPIDGDWTLLVTFDGWSGDYDFRLRARW